MDTAHAAQEEKIAHELVDAAMWAPSVHDTGRGGSGSAGRRSACTPTGTAD